MSLSSRFESAFLLASRLHGDQVRKGTTIPYISHLMAVAALVLEAGGDEDQAIAALLHDSVEDQGGQAVLKEIQDRFGPRVASMVAALSDTDEIPKPPWRERKEAYLTHLQFASPEVLRISLADKLHNARTILADLREQGNVTWERFNGGREGSLWYYRSLAEIFLERCPSPMANELEQVVDELEKLSGEID